MSNPTSKELLDYLRQRLENHSNSISHQPIPLVFGEGAVNYGTVIEIPKPEGLDREQIEFLFAMEIHESAHTKFTSVTEDDIKETFIKHGFKSFELFCDLWNQLEDYRINTLIALSHPGAGRLMHKVHAKMVSEKPPYKDIAQALLVELSGFKYSHTFSEEDKRLLSMAVSMSREVIKHTAEELLHDFLPNVYTLFQEEMEKKGKRHREVPVGTTKKVYVTKRSAEGSSKEVIEDFSEEIEEIIEREETETEKETEEEIAEEEFEGELPDGSPTGEDESEEFDIEEILEEAKRIEEKAHEKDKEKNKELDAIEKRIDKRAEEEFGSRPYMPKMRHEKPDSKNPTAERNRYEETVSKFRPQISHLVREMQKMFLFNKGYASGQRTGKLNSKKAHRLITNGDTKIFRKKNESNTTGDIAVLLLVDESGSMSGNNEVHAREGAIVLHEVLRKIGITHMIVGYTADVGRDDDTYHVVYKHWKDKGKIVDLATIKARCNNRDHMSILTGIEYFRTTPERQKLMIVISDGIPAAHGYGCVGSGIELTVKAQHEAKNKGIKIVNVGIGEGFKMPDKYLNRVKVDNVGQLPYQLINIIKREVK